MEYRFRGNTLFINIPLVPLGPIVRCDVVCCQGFLVSYVRGLPGALQPGLKKFRNKRGYFTMDAMEHISKPSEDVGEAVFGHPEERHGETGPDGSVLDRRNEDGWLDDTEPYHGARPRTTEVDRPVDDVLGATIGGAEQDFNFRDTSVPMLPPEQRIRQEEEVQTPPRREPRRNEGHQRGDRGL